MWNPPIALTPGRTQNCYPHPQGTEILKDLARAPGCPQKTFIV